MVLFFRILAWSLRTLQFLSFYGVPGTPYEILGGQSCPPKLSKVPPWTAYEILGGQDCPPKLSKVLPWTAYEILGGAILPVRRQKA